MVKSHFPWKTFTLSSMSSFRLDLCLNHEKKHHRCRLYYTANICMLLNHFYLTFTNVSLKHKICSFFIHCMGRTDGERVRLKWYSMSIRISPLLGMLPSARSPVYCEEWLCFISIGNGQRFSQGWVTKLMAESNNF